MVGATIFRGTGLALLVVGVADVAVLGLCGRGLWYVEAVIALSLALGYLIAFLRSLPSAATAG